MSSEVSKIEGTYLGMLPCADCEKISFRLQLDKEFIYQTRMIYIGKSEKAIEEKGSYTVSDDGIIELKKESEGMKFFKYKNGNLLMLDNNKHEIKGDLAVRYILLPATKNVNKGRSDRFIRLMQQKRKAGIDFYAFGNEPSWNLDMNMKKSIHFKAPGIDVSFPAVDGEKAMDADLTRYRSLTEFVEIIIQLNHITCTCSALSEGFPFKVHVDYKKLTDNDYTSFDGCGRYTGDYRVHDIWAIIEIEGKELTKEDFNRDMPTMEININTGKVMGTDGCNRFTGSVEVQDRFLIFSQLAGTRMACPKMEMGDKITKTLSGNKLGFEIDNNKMSLFNIRQEKIMVLKHID